MPHDILYVDDEPQNLDAFCRVLWDVDSIGEIHTAASPEQALELLERKSVSAIVTDQRMPGMTGTQFLSRVIDRHPDPVRLILTAYTDVRDILDAINQGHVYYFITKPWEAEELKITLRRAVEHYETVEELKRKNRELNHAIAGLEQAHREQARQYEIAITDDLTGLRNYHYFRIRLGEEMERARRYGKPLSLMFVNVDRFAAWGAGSTRDVGDQLIKELAQVVVEGQRSIDVVARWSGAEFAVLLPETGREHARTAAERLRERVAEHPFLAASGGPHALTMSCGPHALTVSCGPHALTVSCGVATFAATLGSGRVGSKQDLIESATQALASAKRGGRNRVSDEG